MATDTQANPRDRIAWLALAGLAGLVIIVLLVSWWRRPPQMGVDDKVFQTVDALYTAVRSENPSRVTQCEERLKGYFEKGLLPKPAFVFLMDVIARTKRGEWEPATKRLYDFMLAQRREGKKPEA
ncbi:hypothetical protein [Zavarzinella formosa]|uniref:hypothetical protein n=1 Tax=Zavarzinella formosa TaxID=360055 RepID=UPI0003166F73|nr:hypothetical protein [Zavarzinella formosa]